MSKKILALDFDGVINSYESGWINGHPSELPDPPVEGALDFIIEAQKTFKVVIFSSRLRYTGVVPSMKVWLRRHMQAEGLRADQIEGCMALLDFTHEKPPAFVTLDDRALTFTGIFPTITTLEAFQPWNKKPNA